MRKLTAFILVALLAINSLAQEALTDTLGYQEGMQVAINSYHQSINKGAGLYNGVEHGGYFGKYEGVVYEQVQAKYDLVLDKVVVKHPIGLHFELYSPRVITWIINQAPGWC